MFKVGDVLDFRYSYPETRKKDAKSVDLRGMMWGWFGEMLMVKLPNRKLVTLNLNHPALIGIERVQGE